MVNFFSYNKKNNSFSLSGITFNYSALFLKQHHLKIKELIAMKDDQEYSLLWENEERFFDKIKGDPITISWIMEENDINPIFMANIEFLNGGKLLFNIGTLYIQYPDEMDLKKDLSEVLKVIGYFAADEIIDFAENNDGDHNIGRLFGRNSKEIYAIDFDDIKQSTIDLKERYKDIK